jgi:hypothetical protein
LSSAVRGVQARAKAAEGVGGHLFTLITLIILSKPLEGVAVGDGTAQTVKPGKASFQGIPAMALMD